MLKSAVCDLLGTRYPVVQGGMAHVGTSVLAAAVSNAGGLGMIGAGHYQPDWVRQQIRQTREMTTAPFGVNVALSSPAAEKVLEVVLAEEVPVVTTGAGDPRPYAGRIKESGSRFMPVVSTVAAAQRMEQAGADLIVAEGMESGGRVGATATMALIPQVVDSVSVPVIAAGGIADGRGLAAALALGAAGVQMGTRFVCTTECIAHELYKQSIVAADDCATVVTRQTLGYPLRTLRNKLSEQFAELEKAGVSRDVLELFDRDRMYLGLIEGDLDEGSLIAGQIAGLIKDIRPVKDIIEGMVAEAQRLLKGLGSAIQDSID